MKIRLLIAIVVILYLSACSGVAPAVPPPSAEPLTMLPIRPTTAPSATPHLTATLPLRPTRPVATVPVTQVAAATQETATPAAPEITLTPTRTEIPGPSPTFDTLRMTPPTIMLHKSHPGFDAVAFLRGFVAILKAHDYRVVTYMDITQQPDITASEQGRLFIITIDDISLQARIDPSILEMIAILREAGYPAVLGIITEGKLADLETVETLKSLAAEGWELAMHTESHTDLHILEQTSPYGARLEIRTCGEKIFNATGVKPITLVLPYGSMVEDLKILYRENVAWVVGIVGGERYRTSNHVYYVGREGPAGEPGFTHQAILRRFDP